MVHLHQLLISGKVQVIAHTKIRDQLQLIRLFWIENVLDKALAILGAMHRKVFSDDHKTPSAAGT